MTPWVRQRGQQASGAVSRAEGASRRIGNRREVAVSAYRQRRSLAERSHNGRRGPDSIALDPDRVVVSIENAQQSSSRVVYECVENRCRKRIKRSNVTAELIELVDFTSILGNNRVLRVRKSWERRRDAAHAPTELLHDVVRAVRSHGKPRPERGVELCLQCRTTIARESRLRAAGHSVNDPGGRHATDATTVRDIEAAIVGHGDAIQRPERRLQRWPAIARETTCKPSPGHRRDHAFHTPAPNYVRDIVDDVEIARPIDFNRLDEIERCPHRHASITTGWTVIGV